MPSILTLATADGTQSVDLVWHSTGNRDFMFANAGWAPAITSRRLSELGGLGPWCEVVEEIEVNVMGSTPANVLANLQLLARLLDTAGRWSRGEPVSPVLIKYQIEEGVRVNQAVVLGREPGDETSGVNLPISVHKGTRMMMVERVKLRFRRRGCWLGPAATTTTSGVAANPTVQSITLSENAVISTPARLAYHLTFTGSPVVGLATRVVILTASAAARLQLYEAEAQGLGTNIASQADVAGKARGGNVARYSPGVLASSITTTLSNFDANCRRIAVWAAVRNNSTTTSFFVQVAGQGNNFGTFGPKTLIDTSTLLPRIVFLGIMSFPVALASFSLELTASAASGSLDIDYIVLQALDDETSSAITLIDAGGGTFGDPTIINADPLTQLVTSVTTAGVIRGYLGDGMFMTRGSEFAAVWLATDASFWRMCDGSNNITDTSFDLIRNPPGSLVPL